MCGPHTVLLAIVCIHCKISYVQRTSSNFHIWCQRNFDRASIAYTTTMRASHGHTVGEIKRWRKMLGNNWKPNSLFFPLGCLKHFRYLTSQQERMWRLSLGTQGGLLLGPLQSVKTRIHRCSCSLSFIFLFWNFLEVLFSLPWMLSICSWWYVKHGRFGSLIILKFQGHPLISCFAVLKLLFDCWLQVSLHICWLTLFVWGKAIVHKNFAIISKIGIFPSY